MISSYKNVRPPLLICFSLVALCISNSLSADFLSDYMQDDCQFIDKIDDESFDLMEAQSKCGCPLSLTSTFVDPATIVDILNGFGIIDLLKQSFFKRANTLAWRNPLDYTLVERVPYHQEEPWRAGLFIWADKTPNCNYTKSGTQLKDYLALFEETVIQAIEEGFKNQDVLTFDPRVIFEVVQDMRIEDRTAGFMLYGMRQWEKLQLRIYAPLYYHERNFFLTETQLDTIKFELNQSSDDSFRQEHAISDRFGLGDTRIEAAFTVCEKPAINCYAGVQFTLPTAFTMFKGWNGTLFPKPCCYPEVPFDVVWQAVIDAINGTITQVQILRVQAIAEAFFLGATDRLAANLLDPQLGNGGHIGLGGFACTESPIYEFCARDTIFKGSWINRWYLEFLLPNTQKRFFIAKHNAALFDEHDFTNNDEAAENLLFLQNEIVNKFNLIAFNTYVQPQAIFRWTSMINHASDALNVYYGANFWVQGHDYLGSIRGPLETIATLDKRKSIPPMAYQFKALAGLSYSWKEDDAIVTVAIDGDATVLKSGIGRDYMLALRVDASF